MSASTNTDERIGNHLPLRCPEIEEYSSENLGKIRLKCVTIIGRRGQCLKLGLCQELETIDEFRAIYNKIQAGQNWGIPPWIMQF